jgi:uncharacterized protein with PIN domain
MQDYLQILVFIIIGITLLSFGFSLFMKHWAKIRESSDLLRKARQESSSDFQACPICSTKLNRGDLVKTLAFPSITGGTDRLMHVRGCAHCIDGALERTCPVCGTALGISDMLVARIFERPNRRPHVHITGCNKCRRTGKL